MFRVLILTALCGLNLPAAASAHTVNPLSVNRLLDFAELTRPDLFAPTGALTRDDVPGWLYRFYPSSQTYAAVHTASNSEFTHSGVYVLGGLFGEQPVLVDSLDNLLPQVYAAQQTSGTITVLKNAVVTTMDSAGNTAQALAFDESGRIVGVGSNIDIEAMVGAESRVIDLQGAQVLPGFQDVHVHALEAGINESRCLLSEFATLNLYRTEIRGCAADQNDADWFIGAGVSMPDLIALIERPVDLLDELVPNKPALILDNLGHGAWANSLALAAVGFDLMNSDPQGGLIDRDSTGRASGVVYENAQQALRTAALPPTPANKQSNYQGLSLGLATLAENGITAVSDAGGYWTRGHHEAWSRLEGEGHMTVRASNAFYVFPEKELEQQIADIIALKDASNGRLVKFDQVKIYVDGILSQGTSALQQPYTNDPDIADVSARGFEYFTQADLFEYARRFDEAGFSLHFHATGDRGVKLALDAVEQARTANGDLGNRHRITHLFLVDDADLARFAQLGVVADVQLTPSSIDPTTISFYRGLIGSRADQIIPAASLRSAGAEITLSSDWDADELNPLVKIKQAVLRQDESIPDVLTGLQMMTAVPAKLLGHAESTGTIEVGKQADLVILEQNVLSVDVNAIDQVKILATVVAGTAVYDPNSLLE